MGQQHGAAHVNPRQSATSCSFFNCRGTTPHNTTTEQLSMAAPLQTQSLPAWSTKQHVNAQQRLKLLDPSLSSESTISSGDEETDCESDRGSCTPLRDSCTPLRDDRSRLEAYMARKGMTKSAFQRRFGTDPAEQMRQLERLSPCCFRERRRPDLRTTDPMAIPMKQTIGYQGWDEDDEDCRCGNDCGFFQEGDDEGLVAVPGQEPSLDEMIFDLEI
ncbi:hypothetical protein FI667_g7904, partial [Globisporangium splendens]